MKEFITPDRIANAICQDTTFKGTYILVEGQNDLAFMGKFIRHEVCQIQVLLGKQNVIDVIAELQRRNKQDAIGLVDADFDHLDESRIEYSNLLYTDFHDLETVMLKSDAFNLLVNVHCANNKLQIFLEENNEKDLLNILLEELKTFSHLKWMNHKHNWGLTFKPKDESSPRLKIEEFIPVASIKFSGIPQMLKTVFNYSRGKSQAKVTEEQVAKALGELKETNSDLSQLCNGHDIIYLFTLALRKKIATKNSSALPTEQLERELILAYDSRYFENTNLYTRIKTWEGVEGKPVLKF